MAIRHELLLERTHPGLLLAGIDNNVGPVGFFKSHVALVMKDAAEGDVPSCAGVPSRCSMCGSAVDTLWYTWKVAGSMSSLSVLCRLTVQRGHWDHVVAYLPFS